MTQLMRSLMGSSASTRSSTSATQRSLADGLRHYPIIAFCHLSWDWVWQRPQQFLSRLSRRHPVLFVETQRAEIGATEVELRSVEAHPGVTRAVVKLPASRWHEGDYIDLERRRALQVALAGPLEGRFKDAVLWFNDPMAVVAFAGHLGEQAIVYDCMDELSQFQGAPPALLERERQLLSVADVVFCGGQKMRARRLPLNPNCHFFGTGVDLHHFAAARLPETELAPEIAALGGAPVLGYFGVIDERIDYELLARLADARSDWHIVMVGPTAKVDPAQFPRRHNLHWIGPRPYSVLPALTKGFSVCLMPFALNAATDYINPTKALEYMAAGRPVVSTALAEVQSNFAGVARVGHTHAEFITHCLREVAEPTAACVEAGLELAAENTWEMILAKMERLVVAILPTAAPSAAAQEVKSRAAQAVRREEEDRARQEAPPLFASFG